MLSSPNVGSWPNEVAVSEILICHRNTDNTVGLEVKPWLDAQGQLSGSCAATVGVALSPHR